MAEAKWGPYRLFPYELELGKRELVALGACRIKQLKGGLRFDGEVDPVLRRSTYFHEVRVGNEEVVTAQGLVEFLNLVSRSTVRRQATRFGLHGLHEYKGKFNPQVVRALCNVVDPKADLLIDPFCGSGTSLLEGLRLGMDVVGVDRSPIASFISRAKVKAFLYSNPRRLRREYLDLAERFSLEMKEAQQSFWCSDVSGILDDNSVQYLQSWFDKGAFAALTSFISNCAGPPASARKELCQVTFSSILREISLQRPEDLRVRRRAQPFTSPPVWELFMEAAEAIAARLDEIARWPPIRGTGQVRIGSADALHTMERSWTSGRRLILTSPPYATALPYIDTDRFSLIVLGLASAKEVRRLEAELIGSREWNQSVAKEWEERRSLNTDDLPREVVALTQMLNSRNMEGGAGFRRKAVPPLLYRYFAKMGNCFESWGASLRSGESAVVIVGGNRTTAGGEEVQIPTPELLGHVAESRGFFVEELIPLETWPRYGLHARNGINDEKALVLRRV